MSRDGLLIGEVAKRTGATRKALRLYEEAGGKDDWEATAITSVPC
jgi:hypothetical protein